MRADDPALLADRDRALSLTPVSRETAARLDRFVELLLQTQEHTNLIAPSTIPAIWTRHVADSLQLLEFAPDARTWIDLGSGGGFPGIVLACALADTPDARVHLVESIGKKAAFLRDAVQAINAPAEVHHVRIEDFGKKFTGAADVVTARAVAPLKVLLGLAQPIFANRPNAIGLFHKGQDVEAELTEATKYWKFETALSPSKTHPQGRIVTIRGLRARKTNR